MKKRKDLILKLLIWIAVFAFLAKIDPPITPEGKKRTIIITCVLSWIIWSVFCNVRNKHLTKSLTNRLNSMDYVAAEKYLKEKISQYPQLVWMQYQLAFVFALSGQIAEFEAQAVSLPNRDKRSYRKYTEALGQYEIIACALKNEKVTGAPVQKADNATGKMANLILSFDSLDSEAKLREAKTLFSNHAPLIKSLAALYVAKACDENGDLTERDIYMEYALSYAPSEEVKKYLSAYSF